MSNREQINEIGASGADVWRQHPFTVTPQWENELAATVFNGNLLLFDADAERLYVQFVADPPQRNPEESVTETSSKGARDGFTESVTTNVALIRKRLVTPTLKVESFTIGVRSQTAVCLLYIRDIANKAAIDEARTRLRNIHVDALITSSQLEEAISDRTLSVVPLIDNTGRPDFAAEYLIGGRFAILLNGSPMAIVAPVTLTSLIKSPEDGYYRGVISSFQRVIRLFGWYLALFLPAFYIALIGFNFDQVPLPLLATIATNRIGLPASLPLEAIVVLVLFELFKEAGLRLPKSVGPTVTVVGGIIVGDAAIRAGITSPTVTVVAATTVISGYTLVNPTLSGVVSIVRILIMLVASILGMFGFFMSIFFVIAYLSDLKSFGVPYLSPISPPTWADISGALFRKPANKMLKRSQNLHLQDDTKMRGGNDEPTMEIGCHRLHGAFSLWMLGRQKSSIFQFRQSDRHRLRRREIQDLRADQRPRLDGQAGRERDHGEPHRGRQRRRREHRDGDVRFTEGKPDSDRLDAKQSVYFQRSHACQGGLRHPRRAVANARSALYALGVRDQRRPLEGPRHEADYRKSSINTLYYQPNLLYKQMQSSFEPVNYQYFIRSSREPFETALIDHIKLSENWDKDGKPIVLPIVNGLVAVEERQKHGEVQPRGGNRVKRLREQTLRGLLPVKDEQGAFVGTAGLKSSNVKKTAAYKDGKRIVRVSVSLDASIREQRQPLGQQAMTELIRKNVVDEIMQTYEVGKKRSVDIYSLNEVWYRRGLAVSEDVQGLSCRLKSSCWRRTYSSCGSNWSLGLRRVSRANTGPCQRFVKRSIIQPMALFTSSGRWSSRLAHSASPMHVMTIKAHFSRRWAFILPMIMNPPATNTTNNPINLIMRCAFSFRFQHCFSIFC